MTGIEHGTLTGYKIRGCRCPRCTDAQRRYNARRDRLIAYGQWQPYIDAEPVRQHLRTLQAAGLGWKRAAVLAGISPSTLSKLLYGDRIRGMAPSKRVRPATAAAVHAVHADLDTLADKACTTAAGTRRRMQALSCLGWSFTEQARRIGWTVQNYSALQTRTQVIARTARLVRDLYDELSMTPAPDTPGATRARRAAANRGYLPPLAWDDDLIDLPDGDLAAELDRRASVMDDEEIRRCSKARRAGDMSPLVVAGAREYGRRLRAAAEAVEGVAS